MPGRSLRDLRWVTGDLLVAGGAGGRSQAGGCVRSEKTRETSRYEYPADAPSGAGNIKLMHAGWAGKYVGQALLQYNANLILTTAIGSMQPAGLFFDDALAAFQGALVPRTRSSPTVPQPRVPPSMPGTPDPNPEHRTPLPNSAVPDRNATLECGCQRPGGVPPPPPRRPPWLRGTCVDAAPPGRPDLTEANLCS